MHETDWQSVDGTVVSCKLSWLRSIYPDPWLGLMGQSLYRVRFRYTVSGATYVRAAITNDPVEADGTVRVLYDPSRPHRILDANQELSWQDSRKWMASAIGVGLAALLIYWENGRLF